jgi:hypothetical protein
MAYPFATISTNTDTLNSGSYYSSNDLSVFNVSQSLDGFFGNSNQDVIEFSTYDITGNLNNWSVLPKTDTYNVLSGTYKDVDQNTLTYNYYKYNSSYIISSDRNILLNTVSHLNNVGISSGNQVVSYNFLRNIAGNQKYPLIIKSISVDRKEVQLIPSFTLDTTNPENLLNSLGFEGVARKMLLVNDLIPMINAGLKKFNASDYYTSLAQSNPDAVSNLKTIFGFKSDADIIKFLNDLYTGYSITAITTNNITTNITYTGIQNYIIYWLQTYYQNLVGLSDLQSQFNYIITTSVSNSLLKLNHNYKNLDVNNTVTNFINEIFYDSFISPMLIDVVDEYNIKYLSYLKNSLNFGNNEFFPILNHSFITDTNNNTILVVKLFDYLPQNIGLRDTCWVSNIAMNPIIQKVILSQPIVKPKYKIAGPNFNTNPKIKSKPVTKSSEYTNQTQLNSNNSQNQIEFNKKLQSLSVDYSNFSNFILFSSAQLRVKLFVNKLNQLKTLDDSLSTIQSATYGNSAISASYSYDINSINSQINSIYQSFDGYESYLYNNQSLVSGDNYQTYLSGAIDYDFTNRDSLVNNTPEYINADDNNSDYLVFLSMVGHFFDNIYLYIQNFPTTQYLNNAASNSFVSTIANNLLEHFGWHPISSAENSSLDSFYLNNAQYSGSQTISQKNKMDIIWNRLLNNLPIIYKTKGTEESVRLLANIYGIPHSFLTVKEFGGNNISTDDNSSYSFENRYFLTKYSGSNEYVKIPFNSNIQSIEFKFAFNTFKKYENTNRVYLVYKDDDFKVYIDKTQTDLMGTLTFQLHDQFIVTDELPLFNGDIFNVLIQKQPAIGQYTDIIPSMYYVEVNSVDNDRIIFQSSAELLLDDSYATYFSNQQNIYFGNTFNGTNNFYGNIDKINLWNTTLSHDAFIDHCKNFNAYDDYDVENTYTNLYFRYNFEYPINLAASSSVSIPNASKLYNNTASAINFPNAVLFNSETCQYYTGSVYPFQFTELDLTQNISFSNFGPNKLKNLKINKVSQTALARLMPTELSTTPVTTNNDSNLIAACVSPFSVRNDDMLNFVGNYDVMDIIGDPSYIYSSSYEGLTTLRQNYNNYNAAEPVLYQEFFTIYKNYIDSSFFDSVKQLFPARSKVIVGTIIEQSLLERNKYQNRPIDTQNVNVIEISPKNPIYTTTGLSIAMQSSSLKAPIQKEKEMFTDSVKTTYISNDSMDTRLSILSINGGYFSYKAGNGYNAQFVFKNQKSYYYPNYVTLTSTTNYVTESRYEYNFTTNPSYFSNDTLDTTLYPVGHYSLNKNRNGNSFTTNSTNTINSSGSLDGSSPVQLIAVNQNPSIKKLVSI